MNEDQHIEKLKSLLGDDDPKKRIQAAFELAKLGVFDHLVIIANELQNKNWSVRAEAARSLGRIGPAAYVAPLSALLKDEVLANRNVAIYALQKIGRPVVIPALIERMQEQDREIREDVSTALYRIAGSNMLPVLYPEDDLEMATEEFSSVEVYEKCMAWWNQHKTEYDPDKVYILGAPATPGVLIDAIRRSPGALPDAYIGLLEDYTGVRFKSTTLKTLVSEIEAWWASHKEEYIPGVKYFFGRSVT